MFFSNTGGFGYCTVSSTRVLGSLAEGFVQWTMRFRRQVGKRVLFAFWWIAVGLRDSSFILFSVSCSSFGQLPNFLLSFVLFLTFNWICSGATSFAPSQGKETPPPYFCALFFRCFLFNNSLEFFKMKYSRLPVSYYNNKTSWMSREIFFFWLVQNKVRSCGTKTFATCRSSSKSCFSVGQCIQSPS